MMSFFAQLADEKDGAYFYRVILDGGERFAFVGVELQQRNICPSTPEGVPTGHMQSSLVDGRTTVADAPDAGLPQLSREEFALITSSIRRQRQKDGKPPSRITKYYG